MQKTIDIAKEAYYMEMFIPNSHYSMEMFIPNSHERLSDDVTKRGLLHSKRGLLHGDVRSHALFIWNKHYLYGTYIIHMEHTLKRPIPWRCSFPVREAAFS